MSFRFDKVSVWRPSVTAARPCRRCAVSRRRAPQSNRLAVTVLVPRRGQDGCITSFWNPRAFSSCSAAWASPQDFIRTSGRIKSRMDRRRYPRRALDRPAKIFIPDGDALPCRIRNVSRDGAKLSVGWKGWLPGGFYLQDAFTGVRRAVQVVWRGVSGIGVRFTRVRAARTQETGFGHRYR